MFRSRQYQALPSSSELSDKDFDDGIANTTPAPKSFSRFAALAFLLAVGCTIFNIGNAVAPYFAPREVPLAALPRPNQFIGLERVNFTAHSFPDTSITTFPWIVAQIDKTRPSFVFPVDPRRKFTYFGTISPEDRNFLATNEISTIAQFRARDWGMEWCTLRITMPDFAEHHPSDQGVPDPVRERDWILEGDTTDLEVWELDAPTWIDPRSLSYKTRPRRKEHIFSFRMQANKTVTSREFRCKSDEIGSFEFFCVSPRCRVDIWQDKQLPAIGLTLEQRSSV